MIDREKVIRAVDEAFNMYESEYGGTSFFDEKEWAENKRDALALLKEQEAVEPFHKCINKDFTLIEDSHFDFCPYCGKPITWAKQEGR